MARRTTRVARRKQRKTAWAIVFIIVVIGVIGAAGAWFLTEKSKLQSVDENLCPPEPSAYTVVIVDVTDPLTLAQRQDLRNRLDEVRASLGVEAQIAFFAVNAADEELLHPIITRCNPGTAQDFSELDRDLDSIQLTYENDFVAPITAAYERIFEASGSDRSPIMQSIQSVNLTELQAAQALGKPRTIVLISDLLQNTENLSFYGGLPTADEVMRNPDFVNARTNLAGVRMELWMLQRSDFRASQPRALPELWNILLQEQGALSVEADRISG
ncbi:hypothetical protein [Aurantiacibacter gilvus]|uniref:Uncharacterized protein n=1 Tax=Aurantiacibacter gilvus TaxID=3139141 RepID=A0ABU9I9I3_9SPHN